MRKADVFVIYDHVQYTKNDWRNRNQIRSTNGPIWLTIPVKHERVSQSIRDTKIAWSGWSKKHFKSLISNYARADCFKDYLPVLEELYSSCDFEYLSEVNILFLTRISEALGIETQFRFSSEFDILADRNENLVNICRTLNCTEYLTGPSALSYLDLELFSSNGIRVEVQNYSDFGTYKQVHEGFVREVSVLDLLLNVGREGF
ncbi:UNVERIFIED_CONTAM: hypothetical protein GTU68_025431 [Idotea baltica]|nr:hypothetical protein [Idotea baltica]